ncbi:MAG: gliding motility-associated C-terminal domain-containing protein, partial [Saprospiraceae bacterium]
TIVKPAAAVTLGCNLSGVPAGVYTYEVLFNGMVCCTGTATVTQPTPIVIPTASVVTNAICNDKGSINISTTSGGNGGFTYVWSSTLGTTANPTNINAGTYTVTVTDSKSCTATASFTVTNQPNVLTIPTTNTITNVICTTKGAINITGITGGTGALSYAWTSSLGNTANPTNLDAGTYTVTVTDTKGCSATGTYTVTSQASAIVIPATGVVTNGSCSAKGAINIIAVTGANGALTYSWAPSQGNTGNLTNLNAGVYAVTVTDSKGCTAAASFTVTSVQTELLVTSAITNVKCKGGSDGGVQINVTGGCPTYTYAWTGGLTGSNPQGVKAGVYTVTVSDGATPAGTKTLSVTITEPTGAVDISVSAITEATSTTAADGKISLTITGGSPNYKTIWSGPTSIADGNTSGSIDANNLRAGTYNVTVTDVNGCSAVRSNIVIGIKAPVEVAPKFGSAAVSSTFNGFGIKCFGENNGTITAKLSEGSFPVTVVLKSGSQTIRSTSVSVSDISFTGLVAATYTIEATNSKGTVTSSPIIITQPSKLAAVPSVTCSASNKEEGSIELNLNSTGAGNYGFSWFGLADLDNKIENIGVGFYNVTVTDANACELRLTNIEVELCDIGGDCYTGTSVMTPNGDGFNDIFLINCVTSNPSDLSIFDRWGRVIYSQINYDNTWQGVDTKGSTLKEGGYIWVLTVNFGQGRREVHKGTVTILRSN